jgi:PAS domain S-box-containing protein
VTGLYARRQANLFIRKFGEAIDESSQSRDLLRTTLMSIGDAIIVTDQFRSISLLNVRAEELTGWTMQEAVGRKIDEVFHIVDEYTMMPIENPVTTVMKEQRPIELRHHSVLLSRKGVEFPIEDSAAPIRNSRRPIVGVVIVFRDITSRRENEREAEQREREFRALIENAPDVIIRYGEDLRITYVNPAIEQMLGILPQALIGRRFKDVGIPEEVYLPWERAVQDVFTKQHSISTEVQYQTLNGLRRYQSRLVPETTESGVQSVISISRDITEIKQTEFRLRESEQRFRGFVENSPNAFFLLNAVRDTAGKVIDFRFDYLNDRAGDLITLDPAQCLGKRLLEVMPGDQSRTYVEKYRAMLDAGIPAFEEYQVSSPYLKRASWLRSQYVPVGDSLAITTEDITDRKSVQEALRISEKRYRNLVDTAQEAIFSTDETGRFIYCNPFVLGLSGYTAEEALKFYFVDLVPQEHKARVQRHFFRQFLSQTPFSFIEAPFTTKDGSLRWLSITTSLRLSDSDVDGFDCIATDVTAHHAREAQLEAEKARAERSVQESTDRQHHVRQYLLPLLDTLRRASNGDSRPVTADVIRKLASDLERAIERLG